MRNSHSNRLVQFCFLTTMIVGMGIVLGCAPATIKAPENYTNYNSKDGTFAVDYPEGWDANGNGSRSSGQSWAEFKMGSIVIRIDASFADSVKAESFSNGMGAALLEGISGELEDETPEAAMQAYWQEHYEDKFSKYKQEPGESIRTRLGPTFMNKFSAQSGFSKIKGIRATTIARDRSVTFFAHCPQKQWDTFGPVFEKMLTGMTIGSEY